MSSDVRDRGEGLDCPCGTTIAHCAVAVDKGKAQIFRPEKMQQLKVLAFLLLLGGSVQGSVDLYSLELTTIRGEQTTMAKYKGKVSLYYSNTTACN